MIASLRFFACWLCLNLENGMSAQTRNTVYAKTNSTVVMCMR